MCDSSKRALDGNLDGYQKKKRDKTSHFLSLQSLIHFGRYVAKIIFTYILGYKIDVGHMEAVNLISSSKYSEKQIVRNSAISASIGPLTSVHRATSPLRC